jgi:hypothetical protein
MSKKHIWNGFLLLLLLTGICQSSYATTPMRAGIVIFVSGDVQVVRNETSQRLKRRIPLHNGDHVITGEDSRARLRMIDGTVLTLGANSGLSINRYQYSSQDNNGSARLELLKGVMRAVTGAIGKTKNRDFLVNTPVATIGIRGTDFWVGSLFTEALEVALISGNGVYIENSAGRVEMMEPRFGTTVKGLHTPPTKPKRWGDKKFNAALESVSLGENN